MTAYDALAELAQRELELVEGGTLDELPALYAERGALVATLPAVPPPAARAALERAAALQRRVTALLTERAAELAAEVGRLGRGRGAIRGYAPQIERSKLVDASG